MKVLYRNSKKERIWHWTQLISTFVLFFTGLTWYWPWLARLIGGYQITMIVHRVAAAVFILVPLALLIINWKACFHFVKEITHWTKADTKWMALFPLYVLRNEKTEMPVFEGKYNPGQKLNGSTTVGLCALLAITGAIWMFFPGVSPNIMIFLGWSHRLGALVLFLMLGGHIFLGSGMYKPYRGMARTIFGDGFVEEKLAKKIWPAWTGAVKEKVLEEVTAEETLEKEAM